MTTSASPLPYAGWRFLLWRHPEFWALSLSAGAWLLFFFAALHPRSGGAGMHMHLSQMGYLPGLAPPSRGPLLQYAFVVAAFHWMIMVVAMMFPLLVGSLRVVAARSLWSRRNRAMALFLLGYTFLWLLYGLAAEALKQTSAPSNFPSLVPLCFLLAAAWQLSPLKRRSLVECHFTMPLAPSGWRADLACCRYGFRNAMTCWVSCWALMLACVAADHVLWVMVVVSFVSWTERLLRQPRQLWFSGTLLAVALSAMPIFWSAS